MPSPEQRNYTNDSPSPEPKDLKQGKEKLGKILATVKTKREEIKTRRNLSPAQKSEKYKELAGILRTQVIVELKKWKIKWSERSKAIDTAIEAVENAAKDCEDDAKTILQSQQALAAQSEETASGFFMPPAPSATRAEKEKFWKDTLRYRESTYRDSITFPFGTETVRIKSPFNMKANMDSIARRVTNNIKVLDKDTAELLIKYNPKDEELCLDGVETITEEIIDILDGNLGDIFLQGLKKVDGKVFRKLLGNRKIHFFVQGLDSTPDLVKVYSENALSRNGMVTELIKKLDNEQLAKALAAHEGYLYLYGLTTLTEPVAKALAAHEGSLYKVSMSGLDKKSEEIWNKALTALRTEVRLELADLATRYGLKGIFIWDNEAYNIKGLEQNLPKLEEVLKKLPVLERNSILHRIVITHNGREGLLSTNTQEMVFGIDYEKSADQIADKLREASKLAIKK